MRCLPALAVSGGVLALVSIHWDRVSPRPGVVQADEPQPATT